MQNYSKKRSRYSTATESTEKQPTQRPHPGPYWPAIILTIETPSFFFGAEVLLFPPVILDNLLVQYKAELAQWAA